MAAPSLDSQIAQQLMSLKGMAPPPPGGAPPLQAPPPPGVPFGMAPVGAPGQSMMSGPLTLSAALDNMPCRYQLTEQDIRDTFGRWGMLQAVTIAREGAREVAVITFADAQDAADAQRQLHGYRCEFGPVGAGNIVVVQGGPEQLGGFQGVMPKGMAVPGMAPLGAPPPGRVSYKIIVQAESLHPQFPLVPKIRGQGDANVEHMRSQLQCSVELRGKGSGYMEPSSGAELQEQMGLWISAERPDLGPPAVEMALDLLKSVYEEHAQWCQQNGHGTPPAIEAQVINNPFDPVAPSPQGGMPMPALPGMMPPVGPPGQPPMPGMGPPMTGMPSPLPPPGDYGPAGKGGLPPQGPPPGGKGGPY